MAQAAQKIKASTQQHLDIEDITEDLVILKTGWVAMVLSTTAVNFDILSETEQDATIFAYGALLNSLTFPIQILIRSKRADITAYYQHLVEAEKNQQNPDLKRQIQNYMDFVQSTVQQKTILDKRFYLVLSFSPMELGLGNIKRPPSRSKNKQVLVQDAKVALAPKRDHLIKQTARLGLTTKQLTTKEIIELFYDIYNPAPTGTQRVILDSASYTTPMVEPALEVPTPAPDKPQQTYTQPATSPGGPAQTAYADSLPNINQQPPSQGEALKNLKDATAKAAQSIRGEQQLSPNNQPQNQTGQPT
ncbi:MAG: hypothetical protein UY21_C0023G0002 [Microgenomates group bacterium GW2011_GWA1_48_10]|nr:MAG: hypothetical protein UY21_C0023G0002 [Microgenomates group bacterium GW2011_GWA1_48_10]